MAQIVHTKINVQRKITSILLCQLCFNFLLYHTSKIQPLASNLKLISKIWYKCIRTFEYFPIWIFICIILVFFWYKYIRIFIRIAFFIRIYSEIHSYHLFDTNIFGYSFVSFFGNKYIRIFIRIKNLYSPHPDYYDSPNISLCVELCFNICDCHPSVKEGERTADP